MRNSALLFFAAASLMANGALAQTQGTLGPTSTASHELSLTITQSSSPGSLVKISRLDNLSGTLPADYPQSYTLFAPICFYNQSPTYSLTISRISRPERAAGFVITDQNGNELSFVVELVARNLDGVPSDFYVNDGETKSGLVGDRWDENCGNVMGGVRYKFRPMNELLPTEGSYSATLQFRMAAE